MDSQAIGPVEKNSIQVGRKLSSEGSKVSSGGSSTGQQNDTVSLSQRGQAAVTQSLKSNNSGQTGSELRKIDVTDNNQIIVKIVDGKTQKVVRQIPPEEVVSLKQAIQENLDVLADDSGGNENIDGDV
jgi:uncharacterized FlaG/YvyC family protein